MGGNQTAGPTPDRAPAAAIGHFPDRLGTFARSPWAPVSKLGHGSTVARPGNWHNMANIPAAGSNHHRSMGGDAVERFRACTVASHRSAVQTPGARNRRRDDAALDDETISPELGSRRTEGSPTS
jgi:hypothetical protein